MAGRGVLTCRGRERSADLCVGGQTRTLVCLLKGVARAVLLSGTPSPTRPADVFVQVCAGVCVCECVCVCACACVRVCVRARTQKKAHTQGISRCLTHAHAMAAGAGARAGGCSEAGPAGGLAL